ncbi:MAG: hypothetical protein IJZ30_02710 [Alphaproteobacteria bacterium]|nr:hypothetical protein [Alphaproteobacteria bacterium]
MRRFLLLIVSLGVISCTSLRGGQSLEVNVKKSFLPDSVCPQAPRDSIKNFPKPCLLPRR